jgi:hypothetical protein
MEMKKFFTIAFILLSLFSVYAQTPQPPAEPFSLTLQADHQQYKAGENIRLDITITNTSQAEIRMFSGPGSAMAEKRFELVGTDPGGSPIRETQYGLEAHGKVPNHLGGGSRFAEDIPPGGTLHQKLHANLLYSFTEPGQYSFYIKRTYEKDNHIVVKSNTISITIMP